MWQEDKSHSCQMVSYRSWICPLCWHVILSVPIVDTWSTNAEAGKFLRQRCHFYRSRHWHLSIISEYLHLTMWTWGVGAPTLRKVGINPQQCHRYVCCTLYTLEGGMQRHTVSVIQIYLRKLHTLWIHNKIFINRDTHIRTNAYTKVM